MALLMEKLSEGVVGVYATWDTRSDSRMLLAVVSIAQLLGRYLTIEETVWLRLQ